MGNSSSNVMNSSQDVVNAASNVSSDSHSTNSKDMSTSKTKKRTEAEKVQDAAVVKLMQPTYYIKDPLTSEDTIRAKDSWAHIINNTSPRFAELKAKGELQEFEKAEDWFHKSFYARLFDVHPLSKQMFRDPASQGKFLVALFSFIFTSLEDTAKFDSKLKHLAKSHSDKGVKAVEYGVIGSVLFWTLEHTLGATIYDVETHLAWTKTFSRMLSVMVPVAVSHELDNGEAQMDRLQDINKLFHDARASASADVQSDP